MKKISATVVFIFLILNITIAQLFSGKHYPKDYFIWPVKAQIAIAANFGELRPNHYHMGMDCKTDQRENLPVVAAADGYISRINIDATGFGRAIYINHPNGLTTLYAHLNEFTPKLEAYLNQQQYAQKTWKINLPVPKELFPVKQGDFIAYSGNTGGSQGAHLHFEIRDTKTEKVLNPLLFNFPIEDHVAPDILRLALYDRNYSTYEQSPKIIPLQKINGIYTVPGNMLKVNSDKISFAITAYDRYTGSTNQNGIYQAIIYKDENPLAGFEMDSISYEETRYLNAHIDFRTKANGGPYLQHLSRLPGYLQGIYRCSLDEDGVVRLNDGAIHEIKIQVLDANNNESMVRFNLQMNDQKSIQKPKTEDPLFLPDAINVFENENLFIYMPAYTIYDSLHFEHSESMNAEGQLLCRIQNDRIPVQGYYTIKIKNKKENADTAHVVIKQQAHGKTKFKKGIYDHGFFRAEFRDFGSYEVLNDQTPPAVAPLGGFHEGCNVKGMSRILFSATDNSGPVAEFTATIDGQWVLFSNDKELSFIYKIDEHCLTGEHLLTVIVKDIVGNTTEKSYHFTR